MYALIQKVTIQCILPPLGLVGVLAILKTFAFNHFLLSKIPFQCLQHFFENNHCKYSGKLTFLFPIENFMLFSKTTFLIFQNSI